MDIYSTDAKIERYGLRVLEDDRALLSEVRRGAPLPARPAAARAASVGGARRARREDRRAPHDPAQRRGRARGQDVPAGGGDVPRRRRARRRAAEARCSATLAGPDLGKLTCEHLVLVARLARARGRGRRAARRARRSSCARRASRSSRRSGVIQTIPSLALLAFLIAALDRIGTVPALVALFLYALLPIVRNTHAGLARHPAGHARGGARARARGARSPASRSSCRSPRRRSSPGSRRRR